MGSKGSTTNTTQASTYDPTGANYLTQALGQAQSAASNPYQAYTGELTAGINNQQNAAIGNINSAANSAQPAYNQALGLASSAAQPISAAQIAQYESPYTQQVVNATQAQFNNQNAQQQSQVTGNAAMQGALGGDRVGVAQANLAGQQQLAQAPVIAGLQNTGYQTALSTAQQQQQNQENAAQGIGALGAGMENSALSGASAQLGAGTLQQQTQQAADTANLQQFQTQQSYPFQTAQFLSSIVGSLAPSLGGTTSGKGSSTTSPPNYLTQLLGLGTAGLGILSDVHAKSDIEPVGKLFDGTNLYRFKYHGDPRTHIGVLAQEVEKSKPEAVGTGLDGLKRVDYERATDDAVAVKHYADGGYALGGMPYSTGQQQGLGYVPAPAQMPSAQANQPKLPSMPSGPSQQQQQQSMQQQDQALQKFGTAFGKSSLGQDIKSAVMPVSTGGDGSTNPSSSNFIGPPVPTTTPDMAAADAIPASGAASTGDAFSGLGSLFARGGVVKGYDDGGGVPMDDAPPVPVVPNGSVIPANVMTDGGASVLQQPIAPTSAAAPVVPPVPAPAPGPDLAAPVQVADNSPAPVQVASNDPTHVPSLGDIFRSAEQKYGLPSGYLAHTAKTESGFDPNARNESGAAGLFQFMPSTAKQYGLDNPYDPVASTDAAARLAADNYAAMRAGLNRDPTPGELYLAHQQGAAGAIALLNHPGDPASSMVGRAAVSQNGGSAGMSSAQFIAKWAPDSPVLPQDGSGKALAFDADASKAASSSGLPSEITSGRSSYASSPPVPADATASATAPVTPKQAEKESKMWKSLIPGMSDDVRMGLITAGLGMMSSTSPNFGVGVGEGALKGISAYEKAQELSQKADLAKAQIANYGAEALNHQAQARKSQAEADTAADTLSTTRLLRNGNNSFMTGPAGTTPPAAAAAPAPVAGVKVPGTPGVATPAGTPSPSAPAVTAALDKDPAQTAATAAAGAANVAKVTPGPNGPQAVDSNGRPAIDLNALLTTANRYIASGVPAYVKSGQDMLQLYKTTMEKQVTTDQNGNVIPVPGALSTLQQQEKVKRDEEIRAQLARKGLQPDGNGGVVPLTNYNKEVSTTAGSVSDAQHAAAGNYEFVHIQPVPGGPVYQVSKTDLAAGNYPGGPNYKPAGAAQQPVPAGQPAPTVAQPTPGGSAANADSNGSPLPGSAPPIGEQPKVYERRQDAVAKKVDDMGEQFHARQVARERLQEIQEILRNYQPGQFADQKADFVAKLRGVGIPIPDTATANPAEFQKFMKEATKNVFDDVKGMGGRVLVSEIQGLTKANANPEMQPEAVRAVVGQGIGLLDYEDQRYKDLTDWYRQHPQAFDTSAFETQWTQNHPVRQFTKAAQDATPVLGETIPPPEKRENNRTYMTPNGPATWIAGKGWRLENPPPEKPTAQKPAIQQPATQQPTPQPQVPISQ